MKRNALAVLLVAGVSLAVYLPTASYEFVGYDDAEYVYGNPMVTQGLAPEGVVWAFAKPQAANYHPLTWLSLMADVSVFGVRPGAMHLHNAVLHAVNAGLLFLFLATLLGHGRVTHTTERNILLAAAFGALFWSLHPLRVESVAWVSSRKDVLSGLFCLLGLLAWLKNVRAHYGEQPRFTGWQVFAGASSPQFRPLSTLLLTLALFILGYGAKPTMMMFPGFLALVEWLEVGRVRWRPLALFGGVSVLLLGLTIGAQGEAIEGAVSTPSTRVGNAVISVFIYLLQTVRPTGLCCFYPYNLPFPTGRLVLGVCCVLGLAGVAWACWRRAPAVTAASGWFLVALLPVVGLIQVGSASHADRYTYLPAIGISVALAFCASRGAGATSPLDPALTATRPGTGASPLLGGRGSCVRGRRRFSLATARACAAYGLLALLLVALAASALYYQRFWRDTVTLLERALAVTERNAMAYNALAEIYSRTPGKQHLAGDYWRRALEINRNCETLANVALLILQTEPRKGAEAAALAQEALARIPPGTADRPGSENDLGQKRAYLALGLYHLQRQEWEACAGHLQRANATGVFEGNPLYWEWSAIAWYQTGNQEGARACINRALALLPNQPRYVAMREQIDAMRAAPAGPRLK